MINEQLDIVLLEHSAQAFSEYALFDVNKCERDSTRHRIVVNMQSK
jgi:hypothetical protein